MANELIDLVVWDPTTCIEVPPAAPDADLYLLKADHPAALSAAGCLADAGARCMNGFPATEAAHDKARVLARLAAAGLPVPATRLVGERPELDTLLEVGPRFVKPLRGAHGIGASRLGAGQAALAGPGPWLVQEVVGTSNEVVKAYGVGDRVALRRACFAPGVIDVRRDRMDDPDLRFTGLAVAAARATGLECFGADFVETPEGPVLVDVNAFPGYRSVPEAPAWLVAAILLTLEPSR
ncbi:MAG: hypothetical protein ABJC60_04415 [Actinomycetota bacterium]